MADLMPAPPRMDWEQREKLYAKAREKARAVNFTTRDNPLAYTTSVEAYARQRVESNMNALEADADRRADPATGRIYASIMDMRYGG